DARAEEGVRGRGGQAHAAGDVFAVRGDEVDPAFLAESWEQLLDSNTAGLPDQVADHQDANGAARPRGVAVRRVARPRAPDGPARRSCVSHRATIPDRRVARF